MFYFTSSKGPSSITDRLSLVSVSLALKLEFYFSPTVRAVFEPTTWDIALALFGLLLVSVTNS